MVDRQKTNCGRGYKAGKIAIWLVLVCLSLFRSEADSALTQWVHEQWQTDRGLPQNSVRCIVQDNDGLLWIGTEGGLVRFDGVDFKVFDEQSSPRIPHNFVSSLLLAQDGTIWAGTRTGGLIQYRDGNFITPAPALSEIDVMAMAQTADGKIWIGTHEGLMVFSDGVLSRFPLNADLPDPRVTALLAAEDGALWIGSWAGAVYCLVAGKIASCPHTTTARPGPVSAIAENKSTGEIWVAHDGEGLFRGGIKGLTRIDLLPNRERENLQCLFVDKQGVVWVGSQYNGVLRYVDGDLCNSTTTDGLSANDIISIFQDREGSIWVGTLFGGLNRLNPGKVVTFGPSEGLPPKEIACVVEVSPGTLWLGTRDDSVWKYENGTFAPMNIPAAPRDVRAMVLSRSGEVWIGGTSGGLLRCRSETDVIVLEKKDGLLSDHTTILYESRSGEIWVGSAQSGIAVLDPKTLRVTRTFTNDFLLPYTRSIAEDSEGTFWIGTQDGLVKFADGSFTPNYIAAAPDASVRALLPADNALWIGTRDNGLFRFKDGKMFNFSDRSGIRHKRIYHLLRVGSYLWIAGNHGIERLSVTELESFAEGKTSRVVSELLTERDGLRTSECSADSTPSAIVAHDGNLWFGTRRGLALVPPHVATATSAFPFPIFTGVRFDSQFTPLSKFRVVPPGVRLQLSFTAPVLRNASKILFRYKLDGVDKDWVDAGRTREAVYYNLRPGQHKFEVKASNEQGEWPRQARMLAFTVTPHFYQTSWFYGFGAILGITSVCGLYRWRVAGIRRQNETLEKLVQVRTHELKEEITERKKVQQQQLALNADLENRVALRTMEVSRAYVDLQAELRERERVEKALAASESRLRRVVDSGMVGIQFWRKDGRIDGANDTFLRMVGYSREELERGLLSWDDLTPPEYLHLDQEAAKQIEQTGVCAPFEKEYVRKDGSRFPVLIGGASLYEDGREGVAFLLDITERKASEERVRTLAMSLEERVQERTLELAHINEQLASEVQERKRVAVALSAFSQLGQKLHGARTENEAASIIALTAKSLIPHDLCSIELFGPENRLYPVIRSRATETPDSAPEPMRSSISVSIRNGSRVIGMIGLESSLPHAFGGGDTNTLQALGDYCGGALDRIHAEQARREIERRFAAFMANAPALAWMKNAELSYVFTNPMFQEFAGHPAAEIEGKTDLDLWAGPVAMRIRDNDRRVLDSQKTIETNETLVRADGESRILLTLRFPFTTANGDRFVAGMAVDISEQKKAEEALHRLPQSILEAQEQERRRLSRELHDSVNQAIASAKFRIQTAENQIVRDDPKWQETSAKAKEMLEVVLQQVRRLSHNLRPGELDDLGLLPAARTALREFEERTGVSVHFFDSGIEGRLPSTVELTFYRVIQEALTNIEKHSSATVVEVHLENNGADLTLEISDNGSGFDIAQREEGPVGLGLLNMRERASLIGGVFAIHTEPGKGVRLTLHAPIGTPA